MKKKNFIQFLPTIIVVAIGIAMFITGVYLVNTNASDEDSILLTIGGIIASLGFGTASIAICVGLLKNEIV